MAKPQLQATGQADMQTQAAEPDEVGFVWARIGSCFLAEAERMKAVYTDYCLGQERADQALERYEADPVMHKLILKGVYI